MFNISQDITKIDPRGDQKQEIEEKERQVQCQCSGLNKCTYS